MHEDAFKCLYDLLRTARRDGMLALEPHVSKPEESSIFNKYPKVQHNHHLVHFICGGLGPLIDATVKPEQIADLLETELRVMGEEHHAPIHALQKSADALPGFGIVAAVLGIVVTMGHIDGPPAEIGEKVGAALVGTFLGHFDVVRFRRAARDAHGSIGMAETQFFKLIAVIIVGFANNLPPKVAVEMARRSMTQRVHAPNAKNSTNGSRKRKQRNRRGLRVEESDRPLTLTLDPNFRNDTWQPAVEHGKWPTRTS